MKTLIKFISIIGLVSMSQAAIAIDNVSDGDVLTADTMNEIIDATNDNTANSGLDFDIECVPQYAVGDTGRPGMDGGVVFFVTADGCNGLEAAPVDVTGVSDQFGCYSENVDGAEGTGIGYGGPNTLDIIREGCADPADAVNAARGYTGGAENDWYLPSIGELSEMYNTIGPGGANTGGFVSDGVYWSSTLEEAADGEEKANTVNFANGGVNPTPKNFNRLTRPIRTID